MKIAIMQPTYIPWCGYFALLDFVDFFVFLDSVQFAKRSWQQRNQIKTLDGPKWLSIPVISSGRYQQKIKDVERIEPASCANRHISILKQSYGSASSFDRFNNEIFDRLGDLTSCFAITISS